MGAIKSAAGGMLLAAAFLFGLRCSPSGAPPPVTDTVTISRMAFHPAELYVNKWDTVVWINQDMVDHDITQFPGRGWSSDTLKPGEAWKTVVGADDDYFCSIHPTMKGKLMVRQ